MAVSDRQWLGALSRTPFIDSTELALILGEPHTTVHRALSTYWRTAAPGGRATAHLPSSNRYSRRPRASERRLGFLGFETPSDFVRTYPMSREWLALQKEQPWLGLDYRSAP